MTKIFDFPFGEIYEYTPMAGLVPPSGIGKGAVVKVGGETFQDRKYVYKWDGFHDGGEWEVYNRKTEKHVGVLDPATKTWHAKKGAKPGRTLFLVFPVLVRSKGTVFFGPILAEFISGDIPETGLKVLDKKENEKMLRQLENDGIEFPESLYWRFCVGEEVTEGQLQEILCRLSKESESYWRSERSS